MFFLIYISRRGTLRLVRDVLILENTLVIPSEWYFLKKDRKKRKK